MNKKIKGCGKKHCSMCKVHCGEYGYLCEKCCKNKQKEMKK